MSMKTLAYKGYLGSIEFTLDSGGFLYGKLLYANDLVTYEAKNPSELEKEFKDAVDDYLETCKAIGKSPDKSFKGSLNVRIGEELHRKLAIYSATEGQSINEIIKTAVEQKLSEPISQRHFHEHVITLKSESTEMPFNIKPESFDFWTNSSQTEQ